MSKVISCDCPRCGTRYYIGSSAEMTIACLMCDHRFGSHDAGIKKVFEYKPIRGTTRGGDGPLFSR